MKKRFPLTVKMVLLIVIEALALSFFSIMISYFFTNRILRNNIEQKAVSLCNTAAIYIDPEEVAVVKKNVEEILADIDEKVTVDDWDSDEFKVYEQNFKSVMDLKEYKDICRLLQVYQDENNLDSMYLLYYDPEIDLVVYLADGAHEDNYWPGTLDTPEEYGDAYSGGEEWVEPVTTGLRKNIWLMTAGSPIHYGDGIIAYVCADTLMTPFVQRLLMIVVSSGIIMMLMAIIVSLLTASYVNTHISQPVSQLSKAAGAYLEEYNDRAKHQFAEVEIHTGDEIEELSDSLKRMEENMNKHIERLLKTRSDLINKTKEADEYSKKATIDPLTGLRNANAYKTYIESVNKKIQNKQISFGVAMIDLNFLKQINDTCGHDKGDLALVNLSLIICPIFKHSPVFRIGGDEFVCILLNDDYKHADELVKTFEDRIKVTSNSGAEPWNATSAAIGYSAFDPKSDPDYNTVFVRADQNMYQQKKEMKAVREK